MIGSIYSSNNKPVFYGNTINGAMCHLEYDIPNCQIRAHRVPTSTSDLYVKQLASVLFMHYSYTYLGFRNMSVQGLEYVVYFQEAIFSTQLYQALGLTGQYKYYGLEALESTWFNDIKTETNNFTRGIPMFRLEVLYKKYMGGGPVFNSRYFTPIEYIQANIDM